MRTILPELEAHAIEAVHGTIQQNLEERESLIERYEKAKSENDERAVPILMKALRECEAVLNAYTDLYIKAGWESDPVFIHELSPYKPYGETGREGEKDETEGEMQNGQQRDHEKDSFMRQNAKLRNEVKALRQRARFKLGDLLDSELQDVANQTRKKNGKINYTQMGKRLGVAKDTIRKEIERRNLFHLKDSPT